MSDSAIHNDGDDAVVEAPAAGEKWRELVYRAVESDELDYKAPMNWSELKGPGKGKIVRHCLALANTKGGFLVIGVGEDASGRPCEYLGLNNEQIHSFDPTPVGAFLNRCVDPPIDFTIERPEVDGKRYAIFVIRPFRNLPHVCTNSIDTELTTGVFYIRTADAASRPAHRAIEMQNLIQRALRNQREQLGRMLRGILYESRTLPESANDDFREERKGALDFFERRRKLPPGTRKVRFELSIVPEKYDADKFGFSELKAALSDAWSLRDCEEFIADGELEKAYVTNLAVRSLPDGGEHLWQLFRNGMFHYLGYLPEAAPRVLDFPLLCRFLSQGFGYLKRVYIQLGYSDELFHVNVKLSDVENIGIPLGKKRFVCRIPEISLSILRSAADLAAGDASHSRKILGEIAERFNVPEEMIAKITRPGVHSL